MSARTPAAALLFAAVLAACEGEIRLPPPVAGPEVASPTARLRCDDRRHPAATVLHRLTVRQYRNAIADLFQERVAPSPRYPSSYGKPVTGYSTEEVINQVGEQAAMQLMLAAEGVALEAEGQLPVLLPCSQLSAPGAACLDTFFSGLARKAYRRTLTADERAALQATFDDATLAGAPFSQAIAVTLAHLLQSPQFLYVVEDAAGTGRALTGVELASRLSFTLWDSIPDEALLAAAEEGRLEEPAVLASEARRLFESPRAERGMTRFFREWTQTEELLASQKDPVAYPFFTPAYAASLSASFDRFVMGQLRRAGTLESLFTSAQVHVDAELAPAYGVAPPPQGEWRELALDGSRFAGLSTQPLLLAGHAHSLQSSFVLRGNFIQTRLLCTPMGAPPPDALAQFAAVTLPPDPTGKEVGAAITANAACAACHSLLNPAGLAYEHFDATGRWRDAYTSGRGIDVSGSLPGLQSGAVAFESPAELSRKLARAPEASACAATQLFRFTFSRAETQADACALQTVRDALDDGQGELGAALLALTTTDAFTWRADP